MMTYKGINIIFYMWIVNSGLHGHQSLTDKQNVVSIFSDTSKKDKLELFVIKWMHFEP